MATLGSLWKHNGAPKTHGKPWQPLATPWKPRKLFSEPTTSNKNSACSAGATLCQILSPQRVSCPNVAENLPSTRHEKLALAIPTLSKGCRTLAQHLPNNCRTNAPGAQIRDTRSGTFGQTLAQLDQTLSHIDQVQLGEWPTFWSNSAKAWSRVWPKPNLGANIRPRLGRRFWPKLGSWSNCSTTSGQVFGNPWDLAGIAQGNFFGTHRVTQVSLPSRPLHGRRHHKKWATGTRIRAHTHTPAATNTWPILPPDNHESRQICERRFHQSLNAFLPIRTRDHVR